MDFSRISIDWYRFLQNSGNFWKCCMMGWFEKLAREEPSTGRRYLCYVTSFLCPLAEKVKLMKGKTSGHVFGHPKQLSLNNFFDPNEKRSRRRGNRKKKNGGKKGEKRKEKMDENSGHYVVASSRPPERRPLERCTLAPIVKIVVHYSRASQPPECRPAGTPTTRAKIVVHYLERRPHMPKS